MVGPLPKYSCCTEQDCSGDIGGTRCCPIQASDTDVMLTHRMYPGQALPESVLSLLREYRLFHPLNKVIVYCKNIEEIITKEVFDSTIKAKQNRYHLEKTKLHRKGLYSIELNPERCCPFIIKFATNDSSTK